MSNCVEFSVRIDYKRDIMRLFSLLDSLFLTIDTICIPVLDLRRLIFPVNETSIHFFGDRV